MIDDTPNKEIAPPEQTGGKGRNPVIIFAGFMLLGAALALVLFGGDLIGGDSAAEETTQGVLGQVSEFTISEPEIAQLPSAGLSTGILEVGDEAPDFTLNDLDGNPVSLSDFRGLPVVVNFWATWCAPCRIEMPELQAAYDKYQDDGLTILALDQDEPADIASAYFYDEMGLTFTPLLDEGSQVSTDFGSFGVLPSTYFIDASGAVSAIHRGPLTMSQIEGYLNELLGASAG
jgi:cytochrome c biogenesis protein CcmG/thiol:disulfide interchange protein DsbE